MGQTQFWVCCVQVKKGHTLCLGLLCSGHEGQTSYIIYVGLLCSSVKGVNPVYLRVCVSDLTCGVCVYN